MEDSEHAGERSSQVRAPEPPTHDSARSGINSADNGDSDSGGGSGSEIESDEDAVMGPRLPPGVAGGTSLSECSRAAAAVAPGGGTGDHGKGLMPGEGDAIASYVKLNKRIPRRGEVGWTGNEIASLEAQGYVMSGSRHAKMNAIRIRKENQVYTSEEKRALILLQAQQQEERSNQVTREFKQMVEDTLRSKGKSL
jgi:hypothetical protein